MESSSLYNNSHITLCLFLLYSLLTLTAGHTSLLKPLTYNESYKKYCPSGAYGRRLPRACPSIVQSSIPTSRSPWRDTPTWKRGSSRTIEWKANNHHSGFVSFSLVPIEVQGAPSWASQRRLKKEIRKRLRDSLLHRAFSMYTGCYKPQWRDNKTYRTKLSVPAVYPDGLYVFSMVWYGGFPTNQDNSTQVFRNYRPVAFSDHRSCAFVRIRGGQRLNKDLGYQPFFRGMRASANWGGRNNSRNLGRGRDYCLAVLNQPFIYTVKRTNGLDETKPDCKLPFENRRLIQTQISNAVARNNETVPADYMNSKPRKITYARLMSLKRRIWTDKSNYLVIENHFPVVLCFSSTILTRFYKIKPNFNRMRFSKWTSCYVSSRHRIFSMHHKASNWYFAIIFSNSPSQFQLYKRQRGGCLKTTCVLHLDTSRILISNFGIWFTHILYVKPESILATHSSHAFNIVIPCFATTLPLYWVVNASMYPQLAF